MKALWFATLLTVALLTPASAETVKIPSDDPFVTIQVPDSGWSVTEIDKGVEVQSDDDEVYIAVEATPMKGLVELTVDAVRFLNRAGVTVDKATERTSEGTINGFKMDSLAWAGKDKDGDVIVNLVILTITPSRAVLFTYWASPDGDKDHAEDIKTIVRSIKRVRG